LRVAAPVPKGRPFTMRPLRLLPPLLALCLALVVVLLRPLPGRAATKPRRSGPFATLAPNPVRTLAARRRLAHASDFGLQVVHYARHLLGVPYRYGGTSPRTGFDCSGLVRYVYEHFGISLAHSSFADFASGRRVARSNLLPGDLVFFGGAGHVGIYVGHARFIDAPHTGAVVRISTMNGWYWSSFSGARRIR
jgi:cell wall-associated NlpC family hydrolase